MTQFDPADQIRFKAYRNRAVFDLLLRLPPGLNPSEVWDLGCGDGEYTALLARRYPDAVVHGLDSRAGPLTPARARPGNIDWVQSRIEAFAPTVAPGLIFSNSVFHFLTDHQVLLPALAQRLAKGGVLAIQMAPTFGGPMHCALQKVAANGPWSSALAGIETVRPHLGLDSYYQALSPVCDVVDIWKTTYVLPLQVRDAVIDWTAGTGLLPYMDALPDPVIWLDFREAADQALESLHPRDANGGLLLPVERLFILAMR